MKYCQYCGEELNDDAVVCIKCGRSTSQKTGQENVDNRKSKLVAGILQIFFGGFGVGRFYLGYTGIAIAQIIVTFCTLGIGAIWPLIDGILILCGHLDKDAQGNSLKD